MISVLFALNLASAQSLAMPPEGGKPCQGGGRYKVSLSFDDGPKVPETQKILDELKRRKLKASFFVSGDKFSSLLKSKTASSSQRKLIDLVRREEAEGHVVASHSYAHIEHAGRSPDSPQANEVEENLRKNDVVLNALGLSPKDRPFRFPFGSGWLRGQDPERTKTVMSEIKARGFTPVHWDIDSWDWSKIKRKALPESLLNQICSHGGGIILMHDVQSFTAENLGTLIDWIQASGHEIVPLETIKKYKSPVFGNLPSLSEQADWGKSCQRPVGDLDAIWPNCSVYKKSSTDIPGNSSRGTQ